MNVKFRRVKLEKRGENKESLKNYWKKFWFLLWKDDSLKGWIFSLAFLFVFIKFIFFPTLSFLTGTMLPLAIVESCSMYHDGNLLSNYDNWWQNHEEKYLEFSIQKSDFKPYIFRNGFNKGDILFVIGAKPENLEVGDVIIFNAQQRNPIIHRIVSIKKENGKYIYSTLGDNNPQQISFEKSISEDQLVGKAVFKVAPYIGWGKLIFFEYLKSESERGFCHEN